MTTRETLCSAVRSRHIVEFSYAGKSRTVEPYVVWHDDKDEWQLGGWSISYSKSGTNPSWRCYNVSAISNVTITPNTFTGVREGYNSDSDRYSKACCRI
ncbi:MAG: WYL domain-containing protein [Planctomycetes bacterium]|nr:WYL domain-containing protein [Planctomycetota bacterium]